MSELPGVQITQVGLRSTSKAEADAVPSNVTQFWAEEFLQEYARDPEAAVSRVIDTLSDDVYLTFDVDCCDPSRRRLSLIARCRSARSRSDQARPQAVRRQELAGRG